jgi:hypothetical protein
MKIEINLLYLPGEFLPFETRSKPIRKVIGVDPQTEPRFDQVVMDRSNPDAFYDLKKVI